MDIAERKRVQDAFAKDARILISTDAGGERLNLQLCHGVIKYDIRWGPRSSEGKNCERPSSRRSGASSVWAPISNPSPTRRS